MDFCYYMTQRPAMPGAMPRRGLTHIEELDPAANTPGVGRAYAKLTYDRQLTDSEISDYELVISGERPIVQYYGFEIRYNPILNLWDVYEAGSLMASTATLEEAKVGIRGLDNLR